jgi:hypothetical protein
LKPDITGGSTEISAGLPENKHGEGAGKGRIAFADKRAAQFPPICFKAIQLPLTGHCIRFVSCKLLLLFCCYYNDPFILIVFFIYQADICPAAFLGFKYFHKTFSF